MDSDSDPNSSDTTFNPIEWWIGKVSTFSYPLPVAPSIPCPTLQCRMNASECSAVRKAPHTREECFYRRTGRKTRFNNRNRDGEVYDSEVDSFNSRVNGKAIDNGDAGTRRATPYFMHPGYN
jgi:hypothetical protein